jgi:Na+/H+ antiporter NhaD/arsenite permease-like protein
MSGTAPDPGTDPDMNVVIALLAVGACLGALATTRRPVVLVAVVATGAAALIGPFDAGAALDGLRVTGFVFGAVLIAGAAAESGLLAAAARAATRPFHGPAVLLVVTLLVGAAVSTILNLDTTAVLFTPLALEVARANDADPVPFALAALLAANFGSVLLPTSNLTNLVLWQGSGQSFAAFARSVAPIAAGAIVLAALALLIAERRMRPAPLPALDDRRRGVTDRRGAVVAGGAVMALAVALVAGAPPSAAALVLAAVVVAHRPTAWRDRLATPITIALPCLFVAAGVATSAYDVTDLGRPGSPHLLAALGAALAAVVSNLVAVLALEPLATTGSLRNGLLVGVDLGVGLTPIASLATILWRQVLRRAGVQLGWRRVLRCTIPLSVACVLLLPFLA